MSDINGSDAIQIDEKTETVRRLLFKLENALRGFLKSQLESQDYAVEESFIKAWKSSKRKEFLPPRKPIEYDLIYYSNFNELKKIIVDNENWNNIFSKFFGRPDGMISRIHELESIRNTIAHNRKISNADFRSFIALCEQIFSCLPNCEKFLEQLNLEIKVISSSTQVNSEFNIIEWLNELNLSGKLFDSVYVEAKKILNAIYPDSVLSKFTIQFVPFRSKYNLYFDFYSKWADKESQFQYSSPQSELRYCTPDKTPDSNIGRMVFDSLPWINTPNLNQILKMYYVKINPIHVAEKTYFSLSKYAYGDNWSIRFIDGFNGQEHRFEWNGKEFDSGSV